MHAASGILLLHPCAMCETAITLSLKTPVLLQLHQSLLRSITIDLSKKNRDVDVDSMLHGNVD